MNIRDLEYFVAVAELAHFGRAAERCYVSQPTLSAQIRKLEDEFGHPLFDRSTRTVSLTAFGSEALVIARRILGDCAALSRVAKELDDPFAGDFSLGAFPTICPWLFPRIAPLFAERYPRTKFLLIEEKSPTLRSRLEKGTLDAAVLALPEDRDGIEVEALFSEPFLALVNEGHPWADLSSVAPEELRGQKLLLLEDGHCLRDQALDLCHRYGAAEGGSFRATSLETLRQMVRLGAGITLIPRLAVPEECEPGLRYVPFSSPEARRDIGLCFRATHPRRRFLVDLAERVRGLCGTILPVGALSASCG